jgi:cell division protein FtsB
MSAVHKCSKAATPFPKVNVYFYPRNEGMKGLVRRILIVALQVPDMLKLAYQSKAGEMIRNKYVLTALVFVLWLLIFDQNNLIERHKGVRQYKQLMEEQQYYQKKILEDRKRINELKTNLENLEKFAREQYLMKKDNEEIFIIVDE